MPHVPSSQQRLALASRLPSSRQPRRFAAVANFAAVAVAMVVLFGTGCRKVEDTKAVTETWVRTFGEWNQQFTELKAASAAAAERMAALPKPLQAAAPAGIAYKNAADLVASLEGSLDASRSILEKFAGMFNDAKSQGKVAGITAVQTEANATVPGALAGITERVAKTIAALDAADAAVAAEAQSPIVKLAREGGSATAILFEPGTSTLVTSPAKNQLGPNDLVALAKVCSEMKLTITHQAPTIDIAQARVAALTAFLVSREVPANHIASHQGLASSGKKLPTPMDHAEISVVSRCSAN